jgi:NDP-sugar pyrophosphorylase family protein
MLTILLLATAETQKLRPLSDELPAPLIPVANRPVMLHTIDMLARQDYRQMLVSLHHQAGMIESFFFTGQRWGISLDYLLQRSPLGNAGSLLWAKAHLTSTFLVLPADILIDLNIEKALEQHRQEGCAATVIMHERRISQRPLPTNLLWFNQVETGVYVFEPEVLDYIPPRTPFDISADLLPVLAANGQRVGAHKMSGYWNPLETFEDFRKAQYIFLRSIADAPGVRKSFEHLSVPHKPLSEGVWVGRNSLLHPSSRLIPPVYIGENCRVGRNVEIGPDAVLGQNVIVDDEASISDSTILDDTYIGRLVKVENKVAHKNLLIDIASATSVQIVDEHLLSPTLQSVEESQINRALDALLALLALIAALPLTIPLAVMLKLVNGRAFTTIECMFPASKQAKKASSNGHTKHFKLLRFAVQPGHTSPAGSSAPAAGLARLIYQWQLHRLPELWNVVRGDLRLVGVKPISQDELLFLMQRLAAGELWREKIYECPPGFTGLWFVQTESGETREEEWIADAYYAAIHNWKMDLAILSQTPAAWFRRAKRAAVSRPVPLKIAKEGG